MHEATVRRTLFVVAMLSGVAAVVVALGSYARPMVVASGSMAPEIDKGDVVLMVRTPAEHVSVGDVVARTDGPATLVHRVERVDPAPSRILLTTKGDANASADPTPFAPPEEVRRVALVVPWVGHLMLALHDPAVRTGLIVVPLVILALWRPRSPALAPT